MLSENLINQEITALFSGLCLGKEPGTKLYERHKKAIEQAAPKQIIAAVDSLMDLDIPMERIKKGISRSLNLLNTTLSGYPIPETQANGFFDLLLKNNAILDQHLKSIRPVIRELNTKNADFPQKALESLLNKIKKIESYPSVYTIMENIVFPVLEKKWPDYRCVQVMWSIHDDIRRNLKTIPDLITKALQVNELPPNNYLNQLLGDLFFDLYAIKFREERILLPVILETIGEKPFTEAFDSSPDLKFPFIDRTQSEQAQKTHKDESLSGIISLATGQLTPGLLDLLFKHLPVDVTFVNENDEVVFFSDPPHRIFPRTTAVIGRKVQNCHPRESLDIVNRIIESFRSGEKEEAIFWIKHRDRKIQISYYAVRDKDQYKGTLEVSQDITALENRTGEKRLLDW